MSTKKILFFYPNTANSPNIPNAIAILAGIAKKFSWNMDYFDTYIYEKTRDSMEDREISGEFKPSERLASLDFKPRKNLAPCKQCYLPRKTKPVTEYVGHKKIVIDKYINRPDKVGV